MRSQRLGLERSEFDLVSVVELVGPDGFTRVCRCQHGDSVDPCRCERFDLRPVVPVAGCTFGQTFSTNVFAMDRRACEGCNCAEP